MKQKNNFLHAAGTILLFLFVTFSFSANSQTNSKLKAGASPLLEGKAFTINIYSAVPNQKNSYTTFPDEITFINGNINSKKLGKEYLYTPHTYSTGVDSAGSTPFIGFTKNSIGEIDVFWNGRLTGNTIKGTMHWFSKGETWTFSGKMKYESEEK